MKFFGAALCTAAAASVGDAEAVRAMADGSSAPCMQMTSEYTQFDGPSSSKSFPSTLKNIKSHSFFASIFSKKKSSKVSPSFEEIDEFRKKIQMTANLLRQSTSSLSVAASNWVEEADKLDDIASFAANEIGNLVKLKRCQDFKEFMGAVPSDVKAGVLYFSDTASTVEVVECTRCLFLDYAKDLVLLRRNPDKDVFDDLDSKEEISVLEVRSFINMIPKDKIKQFFADVVALLSEDKDAVQEVLAAKKLQSGALQLFKEFLTYLNGQLQETSVNYLYEGGKEYETALRETMKTALKMCSRSCKKYVEENSEQILQSFLPPCRLSEKGSKTWIKTREYLNARQRERLPLDSTALV